MKKPSFSLIRCQECFWIMCNRGATWFRSQSSSSSGPSRKSSISFKCQEFTCGSFSLKKSLLALPWNGAMMKKAVSANSVVLLHYLCLSYLKKTPKKSIPAIPTRVKTALINVSLMEVALSVWKHMNLGGGQDIISFLCYTCYAAME